MQSRINWTICLSFGTYSNSVRLHEDRCSLGWILYWYKTVLKVHHWYKPGHCLQLNTCKPNYKVYNHLDNQLTSSHLGVRLAEGPPSLEWRYASPVAASYKILTRICESPVYAYDAVIYEAMIKMYTIQMHGNCTCDP